MGAQNDEAGMTAEPCALYLVTPRLTDAGLFLPKLEKILPLFAPAAVRLQLAPQSDAAARQIVQRVRDVVQPHGTALILDGASALAREMGCDGVHVPAEDVATARRQLGDSLQLGAFCGRSRDLAMQAGEYGADYVAFGPFGDVPEDSETTLLGWWREMMELPVVAEYTPSPTEHPGDGIARLLTLADFLALGGDPATNLWDAPDRLLGVLSAGNG